MTACLSPPCGGQVIAESLTDGHCVFCGLHHRRAAGAVTWDRVSGPVVVTLAPVTDGASAPRGDEELHADEVRFKGRPVRIDVTRGTTRFIVTVPIARLVRIVARD